MKQFLLAVSSVVCGAVLLSGCGDQPQKENVQNAKKSVKVSRIPDAATKRPSKNRSSTNLVARITKESLSSADQKLMDMIDAANDGESKDKLLALDAQIRSSKNPDVREAYVDALSSYGQQALSALSAYLTDPNEDVARTAMSRFESALAEVDDEKIKVAAIESVFMTVNNAESLEFLAGTLNAADEKLAVETIVRIVDAGNPSGAKVAKESYEALTGEAYTDAKAAEAWLKGNYNPPEPETE